MSSKRQDNVLVTGATGFLGSNLLARLLRDGFSPVIVKRSASNTRRIDSMLPQIKAYDADRDGIKRVFEENSIDTIVHCATSYGRNHERVLDILQSNLMFPLSLLQYGKEYGVKQFINTDTVIDRNVNFYSRSKKQFLEWLHEYSGCMKCINVELEHFYGPFDNETKFTTMIFRKLMSMAPSIDLTAGVQKRRFIYIDDVVDAFLKILESSGAGKTGFVNFQVGGDVSVSIREFVEAVKDAAGNSVTELRFGAVPYRTVELMDCEIDCSALYALGWRQKVSMAAGIAKTISAERSVS